MALFKLDTDDDIWQGMFTEPPMSLQVMINILTIDFIKLFSLSFKVLLIT